VAAAVARTKRELAAQSAATAPRSFAGSPGATGAGSSVASDPQFSYCYEANASGYGPYTRGVDPEYAWYTDADGDGVVCEP
jgi:hypothetical protein